MLAFLGFQGAWNSIAGAWKDYGRFSREHEWAECAHGRDAFPDRAFSEDLARTASAGR
jgi:hypothetical protein